MDPIGSTATPSASLLDWLRQLIARLLGSSATAAEPLQSSLIAELERPGAFIIAPGGYHIRLPDPGDVGFCVGQELPSVREALASVPPLPHVVVELLKEVQNPTSTAASVAQIAASDPSLAAMLLRTVNSAAFGLARKISSVSDAVNYLGFAMVRSIVVRLRLDQVMPMPNAKARQDAEDLWVHSLAVSYIADALAERVPGVDRGLVSTLGLLHDIGKLAILARLETIAAQGEKSSAAMESQHYGIDHAGLGANLAHRWGLPADLVQAIRWHHHPEKAFEPTDPPALRQAVYLVQIANELSKYGFAYTDAMELDPCVQAACDALSLGKIESLFNDKVRNAITRAIMFASEDDGKNAPRRRRFLRLSQGDVDTLAGDKPCRVVIDAIRATAAFACGAQTIKLESARDRRIAGSALKAPRMIFSAPATETGIGALAAVCDAHRTAAGLSAHNAALFAFTLRAVLGNLASTTGANTMIEVAQQLEGNHIGFSIRCDLLAFARRLPGVSALQCQRLVEAELANLLNLAWFESICINEEGSIWMFSGRPESH